MSAIGTKLTCVGDGSLMGGENMPVVPLRQFFSVGVGKHIENQHSYDRHQNTDEA